MMIVIKHLGDLPTRIFVGMLDVGTVEKDASDEGWNDPVKRNADPMQNSRTINDEI